MNELVWLRCSIFSKKKNWNYILGSAISPFLKDVSISTLIEGLLIEFNYTSGENIKFSIQTKLQNAQGLSVKIDDYFKAFFQLSGLFIESPQLPVNGIFMPFPQNTIQYGLYHVLDNINIGTVKVFSSCSNCVVEALKEDSIDEEALITLAFYLHVAGIKTFKEAFLKDSVLDKLYDYNTFDMDEVLIQEKYLEDKFLENKSVLLEIKRSIIDNDILTETEENPTWLVSWINDCAEIFNVNEPTNQQSTPSHKPINDVRKIVNSQLGLTNNMIRLVNYFVNKVFIDT